MPFNPFIENLFAGKKMQYKIDQGNERTFFVLWLPFSNAEHGIEATLFFIQQDGNAPENNFYFSVTLQVSESTDILGIAIKCLQLFTPLFKLKLLGIKLCNCLHKTSHGRHLLIHARKNIGKIFTVVVLNGIVQTHHVARRLTSMKFAVVAMQTHQIFP